MVQAGFYCDMVRVLALDVKGPRFDPRSGQRCLAFFPPVTFGAHRKITHPMARSTSVWKTDSWNVKLRFGDESKMWYIYTLVLPC